MFTEVRDFLARIGQCFIAGRHIYVGTNLTYRWISIYISQIITCKWLINEEVLCWGTLRNFSRVRFFLTL